MREYLLSKITDEYFMSRPNLDVESDRLCIFYVACTGAGKTTLRKKIVKKLRCTYICNDEIRDLLSRYPEASRYGIELKHVAVSTWNKIFKHTVCKTVVFDNNTINYYKPDDSYLSLASKHKIPIFVVNFNIPKQILSQRIINRGYDVYRMLDELPSQLQSYKLASKDIRSDWTITNDTQSHMEAELINTIKSKLHARSESRKLNTKHWQQLYS